MQEIETKILEIDVEAISKKIESAGAKVVYDAELTNHIYRKKGFKGFFRIRERDEKVFTTLKIRLGDSHGIKRREEREHEVTSVKEGEEEAAKLGFHHVSTDKKHRVKYKIDNTAFVLDTVPGIPTYLEIESDNDETILAWVEKLGFTQADMCSKGAREVMKQYAKTTSSAKNTSA